MAADSRPTPGVERSRFAASAVRWNTLKAAGWGLLAGGVWQLGRMLVAAEPVVGDRLATSVGEVIGGAIGGAALFALVAGARNLLLRAK